MEWVISEDQQRRRARRRAATAHLFEASVCRHGDHADRMASVEEAHLRDKRAEEPGESLRESSTAQTGASRNHHDGRGGFGGQCGRTPPRGDIAVDQGRNDDKCGKLQPGSVKPQHPGIDRLERKNCGNAENRQQPERR